MIPFHLILGVVFNRIRECQTPSPIQQRNTPQNKDYKKLSIQTVSKIVSGQSGFFCKEMFQKIQFNFHLLLTLICCTKNWGHDKKINLNNLQSSILSYCLIDRKIKSMFFGALYMHYIKTRSLKNARYLNFF